VGSQPPKLPFTNLYQLPDGYTWDNILYVIGGYNWKALFVDSQGYIITDEPGKSGNSSYLNQWNFANDFLGKQAGFISYHPGEANLSTTCVACHTTGYNPLGNQDNLPGLVGNWSLDGVQCEECHGPGSLHMANPKGIIMQLDYDGENCRQCHASSNEPVAAHEGFIDFGEQNSDLFSGKHTVINCTTCHNPHTGVVQLRQNKVETTQVHCKDCHFQQEQYQKNEKHVSIGLDCLNCHMSQVIKLAWGDESRFTGDLRTHAVGIDPTKIEQFYVENVNGTEQSYSEPQVGLNFTCRHCHNGIGGSQKTDQELIDAAYGYHNKPAEAPVLPTLSPNP
jgi:hypothetical protein